LGNANCDERGISISYPMDMVQKNVTDEFTDMRRGRHHKKKFSIIERGE
jgi:hypothetical protein